jgi:Fic family protein
VILRNEPILETPEPEWVRYVSQLPLNPRQRRALVAFPGRRFVNHDYQNLNQVDRDTAYRELKELVDLGLLTAPAGPGRGARYELVRTDLAGAPKPTPHQVLHARMTEHGFLQNSDYRDVFSVDRARAKRELAGLVDAGVLKMVGTRRLARYVPGPGWGAWVTAAQLRQ